MKRILISAALLFVPGFAMGMSVDDFIRAAWNDEITVRRFLDNGGDVNVQRPDGRTALHSAAWSANIDIMKLLLDRGADVNLADKDKFTVLHYAMLNVNCIKTVPLLCARSDIRPSLNAVNSQNKTPYNMAVGYHQMYVAQIIKDARRRLMSLTKGIPTGE